MPSDRKMTVDGLSVRIRGRGPALVWGHGLASSQQREHQRGWFPWEIEGRSVVTYDARSHGESDRSADPGAHEWSRLADDLIAVVDALGAADVEVDAVGGASMGTATVLHAAAAEPDRFDSLILAIPPTAWETRADLAPISARTLVLAWDHDPGHPVSTAEALVATIERTELHVADRVEDLGAWQQVVESFLTRSSSV